MKYIIQYSPQKSFCNTNYNIEKNDDILLINIDSIITIKVIDENKIECNNVEFTKNVDDNKFHNFILDTYIVNLVKENDDTIYIELLRMYNTKNVEFTTEIQEF